VPYIFFQGRFEIISKDSQLPKGAPAIWADKLGLDMSEYNLSDILDPTQENPYFHAQELERRVKSLTKAVVDETPTGQARVRIRRTRRIKTR